MLACFEIKSPISSLSALPSGTTPDGRMTHGTGSSVEEHSWLAKIFRALFAAGGFFLTVAIFWGDKVVFFGG